jgi:predicted aspartyl protease
MNITVSLQIIDLHDDGFHPLINVTIHDKPFILVLDTGASRTAFDHNILLKAGENASIKSSDKLSTGLGTNNMASSTALISDMHIGDFAVPEFEVAVLDLSSINIAYRQLKHPEVLGVLGGDILMKYNAIIDYGKKRIKFKV